MMKRDANENSVGLRGICKTGSIFVCGPWLHIIVFRLFSIFGFVGIFRSDMLLIIFVCAKLTLSWLQKFVCLQEYRKEFY